ncbi:MAG: hypothetical protein HWN68_09695 [Desulfobacterales bacterium]|nr:hypothetical protein [Desulfobacterales bacterium]
MIPKKLAILSTVLCASLVAFVLLATVPPPGANITLVAADPGLKTSETKIYSVELSGDAGLFAMYLDTGQTKTVEVGTNLDTINVHVYISKTYAADMYTAKSLTRVTAVIKDPAAGTVYDGTLAPMLMVGEEATWWVVWHCGAITSHDLVEGQYTITVKYEIYV